VSSIQAGPFPREIVTRDTLILRNAGLKADNIHFRLEDNAETVLASHVTVVRENSDKIPSKRIDDDRTIYAAINMIYEPHYTPPLLCDLRSAEFGAEYYTHEDVQPVPYRAPEVTLGLFWDETIDIWNLGVLVSLQYPQPTYIEPLVPYLDPSPC